MITRAVVALLLGSLVSCGGAATQPVQRPAEPPAPELRRFSGTIAYEARSDTLRGASQALSVRPARHVEIVLRGADGATLGATTTDAEGRFALQAPSTVRELAVISRVRVRNHDVAVTRDAGGVQTHELRTTIAPDAPAQILARDADPAGFNGALHIADTILRGLDAVKQWTGEDLPPLFVYWGRGVTTVWSFYRGERPAGSNRFMLELLGGQPGQQASSDTDEHDEGIILHELGHFVMDRLSGDSSTGGDHPSGFLIDPGLAWEEGRATWFATAVLGAPIYRDTIGLEPGGSLRLDHDIERGGNGPHGIGSELSVSSVLWDLADGADGLPDRDNDGLALGPAAVLRAMIELGRRPGSYPCLATFLRHLVTGQTVEVTPLKRMLVAGGQPEALVPDDDVSVWPIDIAAGTAITGKIDGITSPAPSGGLPRPQNGYDAVKVYRIAVPQRSRLTVQLRVLGSGRGADRADVDLELRDLDAELLDASRGETPIEAVSRLVEPGWYVVYARDGGQGNRAGYELRVDITPVPLDPHPATGR